MMIRMARREVVGYCTFCRSRCGSINIIEDGRLIEVKPNPTHPTGKALCPKGRAAPEIVHSADRLLYPMRRTQPKSSADPGWQRVSWEEALDDIGKRLKDIATRSGPEAVVCSMTSASASSISDYRPWLERFTWAFGSPNICTSSELCNWHKDYSHALTFGRGISMPDYANTDLAVLWGHNPSTTWLAQAEALTAAQSRGARLVVVDPRCTSLAARSDLWLRITPGMDGFLALAVARLLVQSGRFDQEFVRKWTNAPLLVRDDNGDFLRASNLGLGSEWSFVAFDGVAREPVPYDPAQPVSTSEGKRFALDGQFEVQSSAGTIAVQPAFARYRRALEELSLDEAAYLTGVPADQIIAFADVLAAAKSTCYYCWTGICQHADATQIDRAIATLFALKGQVDVPGGNIAWPAPPTNPVGDLNLLTAEQRAKALGYKERPLGPASISEVTAKDVYRAILDGEPYRVRALVSFGSNPLVSRSEPALGREALQKLELQVHCDLFPNPTANTADYLLPANSAWEREGLRVGFGISAEAQSLVQLRPAMIEPVGESRSDYWIAAEIAKRVGIGSALFDGDLTRAHNYMLAPSGISVKDLRTAPEGLKIPIDEPLRDYAKESPAGVRGFSTPTRRVEFYSEQLRHLNQPPVPEFSRAPRPASFPLVLTNAKFGHFCHTQHRQIVGLRKRTSAPRFSLSKSAAQARGISQGDSIEIRTQHGHITAQANIDEQLDDHVVMGEFGWWQSCDDLGEPGYPITGKGSSNFNVLTSMAELDPVSGAPRFRSLTCEIKRVPVPYERWAGFAPLKVMSVRAEAGDITVVELARPDRALLPPYRPGQFISFGTESLPDTRSYSLIGAVQERTDRYIIAVKREPKGVVSQAVANLRVGDAVKATMPSGRFTLPLRNAHPICFIAFGVGITPFMSQLETVAAGKQSPEIILFYCAPTPETQPFRARLTALERALPNLSIHSFYTRIQNEAERQRFAAASVPQGLIDRRARFYICGSPAALRETRDALQERGVPNFEIFEERFQSPAAALLNDTGAPRRIKLARSGREVLWKAPGSILDVLTQQGVAMLSGCRVGQCESCAVRLLEGTVRYVDPPEGLDEGLCLTCTATPATDVVLDA